MKKSERIKELENENKKLKEKIYNQEKEITKLMVFSGLCKPKKPTSKWNLLEPSHLDAHKVHAAGGFIDEVEECDICNGLEYYLEGLHEGGRLMSKKCPNGLSHVERHVLNMSDTELAESKKELMKNAEVVKTDFGDLVLIKHPIFGKRNKMELNLT